MTRHITPRLAAGLVLGFGVWSWASRSLAGASFTAPALQQIREYADFHAGDEWIETELRVLSGLCSEQDKRAEEARAAFAAAAAGAEPADKVVVESMAGRFEKLAQNDALVLQDVALWQIQKHQRFDPNFVHNLAARSALNAFRLERKARIDPGAVSDPGDGATGRSARILDAALAPLAARLQALRQDSLSADPGLVDATRRAELDKATVAARARITGDDRVIAFPLAGVERFQSFFEIVQALYPDDWLHKRGFGDVYELMQLLLNVELRGARPNASYAVGPFSLSRLTEDLTRPDATQPVMLLTAGYFEEAEGDGLAASRAEAERDPLRFLAKNSKRTFAESEIPPRAWRLHRFLRAAPSKAGAEKAVTQEVYENRLFVLTGMSDQGFFERYRSVRTDRLFFEQAEEKLGLDELKGLLREPYTVPGGDFVLPRYELLEYTRSQLEAETSIRDVLRRIPQKVHIDFIRPVILAIYERLGAAERDAMGKQRVKELADHFGSPAGVVGNRDTLRQFLEIYGDDVRAGAQALAADAGVTELMAAKWVVILLAIESRGNVFAVSPTGALGPFQHTYYFYLKTEPPSIPFDPRKSAIKTGKEVARLYGSYQASGPDEALDLAVASYNQGAAAVSRARAGGDWRATIAPEGRRYVQSFRRYLELLKDAQSFDDVARVVVANL